MSPAHVSSSGPRFRVRRRAPLAGFLLVAVACASLGMRCRPPAPFDQELLANAGFEDGVLAPWQVELGTCRVEHGPSFPLGDAHGGDWLFFAGQAPAASCRAAQELDLLALNFRAAVLDGGSVGLEGGAWLRSGMPAGSFDDQIFYRVRYLDAVGAELGSLRTLIAGNAAWLLRELTGLVPPGTRKLRVELESRFRRGVDNDGFADDTSLLLTQTLAVTPQITKQPMLVGPLQDSMTLLWETDGNRSLPSVEWGLAGVGLTDEVFQVETTQVDLTHFVDKAVIPGLAPETDYVYRVRNGPTTSALFEFRTAPLASAPFCVAWFADNQDGPSVLQQHVANMAAREPDLVVVPGDIVQNGNVLQEWGSQWFAPLEVASLAQTRPVMVARGNHDSEHAFSYAYTALPGNESWYAFSYGNTFFVVMDTETNTSFTGGEENPIDFLSDTLDSAEAQAAEFRIVRFHKPSYTNLWDATNVLACFFGAEYKGEPWVRSDWISIFEQKGVDLVVSGHTHSYQHGVQNGVHYLLVGGGGGALDTIRGCFGSTFWNFISTEESAHHYNIMDVSGTTLDWTAYDLSDQVLHAFQIVH